MEFVVLLALYFAFTEKQIIIIVTLHNDDVMLLECIHVSLVSRPQLA